MGPGTTDRGDDLTGVRRGKGPELKLTPRPEGAPPGKPEESGVRLAYEVDNTADVEAVGARAEGGPGDVVTVEAGYRNTGPGGVPTWTGSEPIEDPSVETTVTLPEGTTPVKVPERCRRQDTHRSEPGGRVYRCVEETTDWWVGPGERLSWPFALRIDEPSGLRPGRVSLKVRSESNSDPANDTAVLEVRVPGTTAGGGGDGAAPPPGPRRARVRAPCPGPPGRRLPCSWAPAPSRSP
ncbi:hypothetical protein DN402_08320 [Streptomyces sp. SW4]|nr:hypothetical protein DN402_08320 [Streptomyces sp. SW4]